MIPVVNTPTHEIAPVFVPESWDAPADIVETDAQDDGTLSALARRFPITDLQHWLDLSA